MSRSKVLLLVTGSIAAYKACQLVSRLTQAGIDVQVAASPSALQFVGAATWEGLSGRPVVSDLFEQGRAMDHIHLVRQADVILAAPASANFINRCANGIGDDLLTTMFLAHDFKKPFMMAPAMNTAMYLHPATQASLKKLREMGVEILETASGVLACGENGYGRLLEPDLLQNEVTAALKRQGVALGVENIVKKSAGKILITAGGTREPIDDVRFITNGSTGASGAKLADHFSALGHSVILLRSKFAVRAQNPDIREIEFDTFGDLESQLQKILSSEDISNLIHAAAISDYVISKVLLDGKVVDSRKTPSGGRLTLELKSTPKLIANIKTWSRNKNIKIAGFKLTSHATAEQQAEAAGKVLPYCDFVVGNDLAFIDDSKGLHPYNIWNSSGAQPLSGFNDLSAYLADWVSTAEAT